MATEPARNGRGGAVPPLRTRTAHTDLTASVPGGGGFPLATYHREPREARFL